MEVYETPRTLFAAQFIGSPAMNIFDADLKSGQVQVGGQAVAKASGPDGQIKLGVRPEHFVKDDAGPFEVRVQMTEQLGANTLLHGRLDSINTDVTISLPGVHTMGAEPTPMRFAAQPGMTHLFDSTTGHRIAS